MSSLHDAVSSKDTETLVQLIREGADLEAVDDQGRTALFSAVQLKHTDMVRVLLESGSNSSTPSTHDGSLKDDSSPLIIAAQGELTTAAEGELDSIVEMLLAHCADVNYRRSVWRGARDDLSALDNAVRYRKWTSARLLVEAGADMSPPSFMVGMARDWSPLMMAAARWGPSELVELMLTKGADPNYASTKSSLGSDSELTALHAASSNGHAATTTTIRVLCEWGADVNAVSRTDKRRTPLHMATSLGASPTAVSALVVAGADPFELDAEGRTVVEAMEDRGDHWTVEVLLDSRPSRFDM